MKSFFAKIWEPYDGPKLGAGKLTVLGLQHTFTMFGATVLVPIITGLSVSVALVMAGFATLLYHCITKGKMPVFLGSSFAFIAPIMIVAADYGFEYAYGGVFVAGLVYLVLSLLVYLLGAERVMSFFPPVVTGPIIIIIGMMLAPVAIGSASENWLLAVLTLAITACVSVFVKGFFKMLPVLCGLIGGYIIALVVGNLFGVSSFAIDFAAVGSSGIFALPDFTIAKFDFAAIMVIAPVAIATMVEHIGDVVAIGATTEKDFIKSPGLHRTLIGDGLGTSISAFFGGPANTTYSENTGVLALTKVFQPAVMRIAACFAIFLGLFRVVSDLIGTIPGAVIGGVSIILFGMIAAVGARTLIENKVDLKKSRNLIIAAVILVLGLGGAVLPVSIGAVSFELSGVGLAAIVGIILNKCLPEKFLEKREKEG